MRENPYSNDTFPFLYSILFDPVFNDWKSHGFVRSRSLFDSYLFVEGLLWMKLAFRIGYIARSALESFLQLHEPELVRAYSTIYRDESKRRVDVERWSAVFDVRSNKISIDRNRLFKLDTTQDVPPSVLVEFQNLVLLSSEVTREEPTKTFLHVLNFGSDGDWRSMLLMSSSSPLSAQEVGSSVVGILSWLSELLAPSYEPLSVKRAAREIELWKLNFDDRVVDRRFRGAIRMTRDQIAVGKFRRFSQSMFDHMVESQMLSWTEEAKLQEHGRVKAPKGESLARSIALDRSHIQTVAAAGFSLGDTAVDLSRRENRIRLSPAAIKGLLRIAEHWKLRDEDTRALLGGMSRGSFYGLKGRHGKTLDEDQLTRISLLIGIFKALNILYSRKLADSWISLPNTNPMFGGDSALNYITKGGIPALIRVRQLLERVVAVDEIPKADFAGTGWNASPYSVS